LSKRGEGKGKKGGKKLVELRGGGKGEKELLEPGPSGAEERQIIQTAKHSKGKTSRVRGYV
jgi:hypothetical protein